MPAPPRPRLHDHQLEADLLGALLSGWPQPLAVLDDLHDELFDQWTHRVIAGAIVMAHARHGRVDVDLVAHELDSIGWLRAVGGKGHLEALRSGTPAISAARTWVQVLHGLERKRARITGLTRALEHEIAS